MQKSVLTTFIRQDLANKSLFIGALSQIVVKILYIKNSKKEDIKKNVDNLVSYHVEETKIDIVLDELIKKKFIKNTNGLYSLNQKYRAQIKESDVKKTSRFNQAIEEYFKNARIEQKTLYDWFDDMNIAFFNEYNNEWLEDFVGRSQTQRKYIENFKASLSISLFDKYKIKKDERDWFFSQYISFLRSNNSENGLLMLDYANSLFASKLVSANIFADKSIKDLLQNATVVLDTNVLLYLNLEKDIYSKSYKSLEEVFILLNIMPVYLHITKEEYSRVIEYKINLLEKVCTDFNTNILKDSDDAFLQTMLYRECSEADDYANYFTSLRQLPDVIYKELKITEYDNTEVIKFIETEVQKNTLQPEINALFMRYRTHSKRENSLNHDAGLISGLKFILKNNNAWILTRDGSVHEYSVEHTRVGESPLALKLSTVINLLCINEGGIDLDPSNFGPLFSQFVKNNIISLSNTFQLEDLTRMSEIESTVSQLPDDNIVQLAKEINRDRIKGENDHDIAVKIQRCIQSYKIDIKDELVSTKTDLANTKQREQKLINKNENIERNFRENRTKELMKQHFPRLRCKFLRRFFIQVLILLVGFILLLHLVILNNQSLLISIIASITVNGLTSILTGKYLWITNYHKQKIKKQEEIEALIEQEWCKLHEGKD